MLKCFHKYIDIWNSKLTNKISSHKNWNYDINLVLETKSSTKKNYKLFKNQATIIKKYVDDMLRKRFIKLNTLKYAALVLIVKKLDEGLRVCVNYRALNALIIKNRNAPSLIKDIFSRFCVVKWYNKFDIITIFNEIRMREKDEKKIAFLTRYDLFKYVVILFDLCNAFKIFQLFINATLHEYLNDFCTSYMNNILIYFKTREEHVRHMFKILKHLQKVDLYLNINKCEFFVIEVRYLNLIIIIEGIKINSSKIDVVINWLISRNLKNV